MKNFGVTDIILIILLILIILYLTTNYRRLYKKIRNSFRPDVKKLAAKSDIPGLIRAMGKHYYDANTDRDAVSALVKIGEPAVQPLIAALRSKNIPIRENSSYALGQIKDSRAVEPIIAALTDEDKEVRRAAASSLGQIGDVRAVDVLIAALHDEDQYVVSYSAEALGKIGDARAVEPLIASLDNGWMVAIEGVSKALGELKDRRSVIPLVDRLRRWIPYDSPGSGYSAPAIKALGKIGDPRTIGFLISLKGQQQGVRNAAAKALDNYAVGKGDVDSLLTFLSDPNHELVARCVKLLGKIGDERAIDPLLDILRKGDLDFSRSAIEALGKIKDARVIDPLIAALQNPDRTIQKEAAEALKNFDNARAMQALEEKQESDLENQKRFEQEYPVGPQLAKLFDNLKHVALPSLTRIAEDSIKHERGLYDTYVKMTGYWHGFEGTQQEAFEQLWMHFSHDHPDSKCTCSTEVAKDGSQLNIYANTPREGYQHFVWRTLDDKYILMLSDFR